MKLKHECRGGVKRVRVVLMQREPLDGIVADSRRGRVELEDFVPRVTGRRGINIWRHGRRTAYLGRYRDAIRKYLQRKADIETE